ncbi:MAG TPA: hypothetical protein VL202_10205 [Pararhizobium sp.]|uniref:hypothetical protein n=1 Tax=Pararhizobium sp. TaxID=1977563 RepID=UPI002C205FFB|nr:hypothetical protein [Pararhizobium sp.]HTO31532.1 hypothetical protein [Pararhizobium sp.]
MPTSTAIFWPVIAQVALVFSIYFLMMKRRFGAVRAGTAKAHDGRRQPSGRHRRMAVRP